MTNLRPIDMSDFTTVPRPAECGAVPDQRWLPIDRLVVDPSYQRDIAGAGRKNVRRIAETFAWPKFSAVVCSPIEGGYFAIIDGQHRTTAAKLLGFSEVPCQVVVASRREQAEAFTAINGNTTPVRAQALFYAKVEAGDPVAAEILAICTACGVTILKKVVAIDDQKPGQTMATRALETAYGRYGRDVLTATLQSILRSGNGEVAGVLAATIIFAVATVLHDHDDWRRDAKRLAKVFEDLDLDEMLLAARVEAHRRKGLTAGVLLEAKIVDALEKVLG